MFSDSGIGEKPITIPTFKVTTTQAPNTTAINATASTSNVTQTTTVSQFLSRTDSVIGNTTAMSPTNATMTQNTTIPSVVVAGITLMMSTPASSFAIQE